MYAARVAGGTVIQVIVGDAAWAAERLGGEWINSDALIGVGWTWDGAEFRPPQPYPSWSWDGAAWQAPAPYPDEGDHEWDENAQAWVALEGEA